MTDAPARLGRLLLVPAPLDFGCDTQADLRDVLPEGTLRAAAGLAHWVCENAKTTRAYLKRIDAIVPLAQPLQAQQMHELPREVHKKGDHQHPFDARALLADALQGHDIGLVSEAGMPAVADPGASVVRAAHALGLTVVPLVGPVSLLLALAASGLNGQQFAFVGYLPQDATARAQRIRELDAHSSASGESKIFIETPYRNPALWDGLMHHLRPGTRLAVSSGLTLAQAQCLSQPVAHWRTLPYPLGARLPAVFVLGPDA
jgi:16S rRNA (cytidine1402-2'-O)-methyltransferase